MEMPEPLVKEQPVMKETVEKEPEDLSETMVLPDVKKKKKREKKKERRTAGRYSHGGYH